MCGNRFERLTVFRKWPSFEECHWRTVISFRDLCSTGLEDARVHAKPAQASAVARWPLASSLAPSRND
jgi:hypothetical protein